MTLLDDLEVVGAYLPYLRHGDRTGRAVECAYDRLRAALTEREDAPLREHLGHYDPNSGSIADQIAALSARVSDTNLRVEKLENDNNLQVACTKIYTANLDEFAARLEKLEACATNKVRLQAPVRGEPLPFDLEPCTCTPAPPAKMTPDEPNTPKEATEALAYLLGDNGCLRNARMCDDCWAKWNGVRDFIAAHTREVPDEEIRKEAKIRWRNADPTVPQEIHIESAIRRGIELGRKTK